VETKSEQRVETDFRRSRGVSHFHQIAWQTEAKNEYDLLALTHQRRRAAQSKQERVGSRRGSPLFVGGDLWGGGNCRSERSPEKIRPLWHSDGLREKGSALRGGLARQSSGRLTQRSICGFGDMMAAFSSASSASAATALARVLCGAARRRLASSLATAAAAATVPPTARAAAPWPSDRRRLSLCSTRSTLSNSASAEAAPAPAATGANTNISASASASASASDSDSGVRSAVLAAALKHVARLGWTNAALAAGVADRGLSAASVGMFARGPVELVEHFIESCNARLLGALVAQNAENELRFPLAPAHC
jgi:hypothetical protein